MRRIINIMMKYTYHKTLIIILISILAGIPLTVISSTSSTLSYQGKLTDSVGNPVADSTYNVTFLLYPDSVAGSILWAENGTVTTTDGLFTYILGNSEPLTSSLFSENPNLYLEIRINNNPLLPRSSLSATGYAFTAGSLRLLDENGIPTVVTDPSNSSLIFYDSTGVAMMFQPAAGDTSVMLPNDAINAGEILNEPGVSTSINSNLVPLMTGEMQDLITITVEIPDDGYIVVQGKCYLLLSGTTGPNTATVQIDQNEGGGTNFPYFQIAGLSGYVNTGTNYFPVFLTRTYYKSKGTYTFRLEGRASYEPPAVAQSWDHILVATYYPTSYYGVQSVITNTDGIPAHLLTPLERTDSSGMQYYKIDWHQVKLLEANE